MRTVKDAMDWNRRLGHFGGNFGTNFSGHPSPHVRVKREPLWGIVLKAKGIAALLHIAAALPLLLGLNLWVDEAYSLHTSHQPLGQVIVQAMRFEQQPPLYFAVLALWRWISPSVTWARLFSLLCTTLTVVVGGATPGAAGVAIADGILVSHVDPGGLGAQSIPLVVRCGGAAVWTITAGIDPAAVAVLGGILGAQDST